MAHDSASDIGDDAAREDATSPPIEEDVTDGGDNGKAEDAGEITVEARDPLLAAISSHLPLLATVLLFALTIVRVLRVSAFDPATATALVRESGPVAIVIGVLVTSFPSLLWILAYFLVLLAHGGPGSHAQRRFAWLVALAAWYLLTVVEPWPALLIASAFLIVVFIVQRRLKWSVEVFAITATIVASFLDVPRMWLPPERVDLAGAKTVTAYVLSVDSDWTTLLEEVDRRILVVPTGDIIGRTVCNVTRVLRSRTISQILFGEEGGARNPPCPTLEVSTPSPLPEP